MQTKKSMNTGVPFIVLGLFYAYLLYLSWTPDTLKAMFSSKYYLPEVCVWLEEAGSIVLCSLYIWFQSIYRFSQTTIVLVYESSDLDVVCELSSFLGLQSCSQMKWL